jgi:hypothetical protein
VIWPANTSAARQGGRRVQRWLVFDPEPVEMGRTSARLSLIICAVLALGACGSSSRSPANKGPTTSVASTSTTATTATEPSATTSPPSATTPTTTETLRQILPPATVAPRVDECTQQLSYGADGNAGPITCSNGDLNVLAWMYLAKGNPLVMALGPDATPSQVEEALCADVRTSTNVIETSAYRISALYYH